MSVFRPKKSKVPLDLEHMKDVMIVGDVAYRPLKFIVAKITHGEKVKSVLYAENPPDGVEYVKTRHNDIFNNFKKMLDAASESVEIEGGAALYMDSEKKTILLWGSSAAYGSVNFKEAKEALEGEYKDYKVTVIYELKSGNERNAILYFIANSDYGSLTEQMKFFGINSEIVDGKRALHMAVEFCNPDMVLRLLQLGADTTAKDDDGNTPFALAESRARKHKPDYNENWYSIIVGLLRDKAH
jgi:hypothetical protein